MKTETIRIHIDIDTQAIENLAERYFFLLELGRFGRKVFTWCVTRNIKKYVRIRHGRNEQQGVES